MAEQDAKTSAGRILVRMGDDDLEAWVSLAAGPPGGSADLRAALEAHGITFGVDATALRPIERALASRNADPTERRVALGLPAKPAIPRRLELEDPEGPLPGRLRPDGSMDFRERRSIVPVSTGDRVARLTEAVPGTPGTDVHGTPVEAEAATDVAIELGDGVTLEADGGIVATRDGARAYDPQGGLDVVEVHTHPGSVDPASGNLETPGHLEVARDVTAHMQVRAGASVRIGGLVDGGRVEAGLAVEIVGGVIGREDGAVRAGTDLRARHALGARLHAGGRIEIARSVSGSRLHGREVEIGGRALSERIAAEERILVQQAGSPAGGPIELHVGIPLEPEDFDPTDHPVVASAPRAGRRKRSGSSARSRRARGARDAGRENRATREEIDDRIRWRLRQRELLRGATIEIGTFAHAGCRLAIGSIRRVLDADTGPATYRLDEDQRRIVADESEEGS